MNDVRDPQEALQGDVDIDFLWRKISAAGEMKTAIKRFLSDWDAEPDYRHAFTGRVAALRKAMEDYLNLT
jgi:hypothetical protein